MDNPPCAVILNGFLHKGNAMKNCHKCNVLKPLSEYYKHSEMADGHLNICKDCVKKRVTKHRLENLDRIQKYDRQRAKLPHRLEKAKIIFYEWKIKNPKKRTAQNILNAAVRDKKIIPLPCFICGGKAEAHHHDYDRPLDVMWLCSSHHKQTHALIKKGNT